jgi:peptidylprolyl isomerase
VPGQTLITQYVGLNWRTGKAFDSSWARKQPFGFQLDAKPAQIIPAWDKGLIGVPVGSRVMLIVPPAQGYGKTGNTQAGIKGTDTLVLHASGMSGNVCVFFRTLPAAPSSGFAFGDGIS